MSEIFAVFTRNILPILIVAGFGYSLRRWFNVEQKPLSSAVFNVLSPALVFSSLITSQIAPEELLQIGLFTVIVIAIMGVIGLLLSPILRLKRTETSALLLLVMFVNGGNYGLTLVQLRYGEAGLSRAVVYYVTSTILLYTVGVFIASSGRVNWRETLSRMTRLPAVYAAVLAVMLYYWQIPVPGPIMSAVEIAAAGANPVLLLLLGMQHADLQGGINLRLAVPAVSLRLVAGPVVGAIVAAVIGLKGLSRSAAIIETSMPSAVITTILATEFGLPAPAVTSIVVLSTLISPLTVSATITLMGL